MKLGKLFEKRDWYIDSRCGEVSHSRISCHGNFFQMMHVIFRIMTRK